MLSGQLLWLHPKKKPIVSRPFYLKLWRIKITTEFIFKSTKISWLRKSVSQSQKKWVNAPWTYHTAAGIRSHFPLPHSCHHFQNYCDFNFLVLLKWCITLFECTSLCMLDNSSRIICWSMSWWVYSTTISVLDLLI